MRQRVFVIAARISAILLGVALLLAAASSWLSPWSHWISLGESVHLGVWNGWGPRLVIFSDEEYGPYRGSVIGLVDGDGKVYPRDLKKAGFGDVAGIYYRHFTWTGSTSTLWTLMISLWYPIALFAILPAWRIGQIYRCRRSLS